MTLTMLCRNIFSKICFPAKIFKLTNKYCRFNKFHTDEMSKSKFEYVRNFETDLKCLLNCWIVVRLDGKGFHEFAKRHGFEKPNDKRALELMSRAAANVLEEFRDVCLAYGQSDEYSFVFRKDTTLYNRRYDKILSYVNSVFSSAYVFHWGTFFRNKMLYPSAFDARIVLFPTDTNLRDYLSWRQADAHVNNLYNTCFWALVLKKGMTNQQAEAALSGTLSSHKNELLYKDFGINYNNEPPLFRKGTTLIRKLVTSPGDGKLRHVVLPVCCDIISDEFWKENPEILGLKSLQVYNNSQNLPTFGGTKNYASLVNEVTTNALVPGQKSNSFSGQSNE